MRVSLTKITKFTTMFVIAASVFGPATALAAQTPTTDQKAQAITITPLADNTPAANGGTAPAASPTNNTSTVSPAANGSSGTGPSSDLQCSFTDSKGLAVCVSELVYWPTVGLGSLFANIAAYIFDYAVMLSLASGAYALDFIAIGWGIVRDVANMSFLFILVYIAFKIMFQAETAGTMRMLVWVVIVALLVNFSFLMTRVVIDAGNIAALQFYNAVAANSTPIPGQTGQNQTKDITSTIINALSPQGLLGSGGQIKNVAQQPSAMYYLIITTLIYIMTGITLFMVAAVFIFAAIRFIMRVIGLWFVIIGAPGAFVAAIFSRGKINAWFSAWLGYLLEFTFYPAVFLFMFYIEIRFMQEMGSAALFNGIYNATQTADWTTIAQAAASVGVRLGFILATMYLILRASQWMGKAFNSVGTNWVHGKISGSYLNPLRTLRLGGVGVTRLGGLVYQQGVGRQAANIDAKLKNTQFGNSWLGYRARGAAQSVAGSSLGGARSFSDFTAARNKETKERGSNLRDMDNRALVDRVDANPGGLSEGERRRIAGLTQREIEALGAERVAKLAGAAVPGSVGATFWGDQKMRSMQKSDKFTDAEKEHIYQSWENAKKTAAPSVGIPPEQLAKIQKATGRLVADEAIKLASEQFGFSPGAGMPIRPTPTNTPSPAAPAAAMPAPSSNHDLDDLRGEVRAARQSVAQLAANILNNSSKPPPVVVQTTTQPAPHVQFRPAPGHEGLTHDQISELAKKVAHKLEPELTGLESALESRSPGNTPPAPAAPGAMRPVPKVSTDVIGPQSGEGRISA